MTNQNMITTCIHKCQSDDAHDKMLNVSNK